MKTSYDGYMATKPRPKVCSYIRCSTQRQGKSGLGLEAQRAAVTAFCRENDCELVEEFQEVESGRKDDRPVLKRALARAKATKSTLFIAKLDRLGRDLHFISGLMKEGVDFRAGDAPGADPFMLHVRAAFAEEEARRISQRTKDALAAYKARGGQLGASNPRCRNLTRPAARKGAKSNALRAQVANAEASAIISALRDKGLTLVAIASELDARGIFTRTGRTWSAMQVSRLLARA
jgi:DNA invertase Pin-like site-specific DNA recombinase